MKKIYFEVEDNFGKIINKALNQRKIIKIEPITTGWTNIVYEVYTDEGNYFFRFPRDEFWSRTIVKDYEFAKYIYGKTDFKTTELKLLYDDNRPFSMHKKIEGKPLAIIMNDLTEDQIKVVCKDISKFMYQLHNIKYNENDVFTINNIGLNLKDFLEELLNKHVSEDDRLFWEKSKNNKIDNDYNCLVHGDLNSSNILLNKDNQVEAVIDFGFGGFGNKYDDLARIIGRCPNKFRNEIVKSYQEYANNKINEEFLNQNIKKWENIDNGYINYMRTIGIYD